MVVKVGRNEPCPCGSGKKYKKCCLPLDEIGARQPVADEDGRWVEVGAQAEFVRYIDGGVILRGCIQDKKGKIIPGKLEDEFFVPNEMILPEEVPVTSCSRGSSIKQKETCQRTSCHSVRGVARKPRCLSKKFKTWLTKERVSES